MADLTVADFKDMQRRAVALMYILDVNTNKEQVRSPLGNQTAGLKTVD